MQAAFSTTTIPSRDAGQSSDACPRPLITKKYGQATAGVRAESGRVRALG